MKIQHKVWLTLSFVTAVFALLALVHLAGRWTLIPALLLLMDGATWAWFVAAWLVGKSMVGGKG